MTTPRCPRNTLRLSRGGVGGTTLTFYRAGRGDLATRKYKNVKVCDCAWYVYPTPPTIYIRKNGQNLLNESPPHATDHDWRLHLE